MILPISASQVARMSGMSYPCTVPYIIKKSSLLTISDIYMQASIVAWLEAYLGNGKAESEVTIGEYL
jgi:hypothetical protein